MRNALDVLQERGLIDAVTNVDEVRAYLAAPGARIYIGFDPTAASLHVGHLLPILVAANLQRFGVTPILLVGGATGVIGDPSGRSTERTLMTLDTVVENTRSIGEQLRRIVSFEGPNAAILVNNHDWIGPIRLLDWLRDVGKHFSVNMMLAKDSVKRRLESRDDGLSYTEFSYMLLQSYDFLHLFRTTGCRLQGGGSDQWGNITAGMELVRRVEGEAVFGITFPLVTTSSGEKFGKSAGNAVWLDPALTSPFAFYQFWFNTDDADVQRYLQFFTFLPMADIEAIVADHRGRPEERRAQRRLALEVTSLVHGPTAAEGAERVSDVVFRTGAADDMTPEEWQMLMEAVPSAVVTRTELNAGLDVGGLCVLAGLASSGGEARRLVQQGGLSMNGSRVEDARRIITESDLRHGRFLLLRRGSRTTYVVRFA